jgi:hypothetical protein
MKPNSNQIIFWTPRVLCLLFAAFISLFALDVFEESHGVWRTTVALLMHLIPTFILLALLALSWRWDWVGGVVFPGLGIFYLVAFWGRFHWSAYALIAGPLFLVGTLFLLSWRQRKNVQPAQTSAA